MSTLFDTYIPSLSELDTEELQSFRAKLAAWIQANHPDVDHRPNTPFGDLFLTPEAETLKAELLAWERLRSDLDLANVAAGTIYDCDFVAKFLESLAVMARTTVQASGVVRLIFCEDKAYTLDRGLRVAFNGADDGLFEFRLPYTSALEILPVGGQPEADRNQYPLRQLSATRYAVDLPVQGQMETLVTNGTAGQLDQTITDLDSVVAVGTFHPGTPPSTLKSQAARARDIFYSASMNSRYSARSFLMQQFPDLGAASVVVSGDDEMLRDSFNALGLGQGRLDAHVKSSQYRLADSQNIRLTYDSDADAFVGKLDLLNPAIQITSIASVAAPTVTLDDGNGSVKIFSRSTESRAPMLTAAYSPVEELWVIIAMPRSTVDNSPLITPDIDANDVESSVFTVSYLTDPLIRPIHDFLQSRDYTPPGTDVLVRGFIPIVFDSLNIYYSKPPGVAMKLDRARSEIGTYLRGLAYPDRYSDSVIGDSLFYAGASSCRVEAVASVRFSAAQYVMKSSALTPDVDPADTVANSLLIPVVTLSNSSGFRPTYLDPALGGSSATYATVGKRTVGYSLADTDINFIQES